MYCYRRYGHNEGDEPLFTQPDLYAKIAKRPSVAQLYKKELIDGERADRGGGGEAGKGFAGPARDARSKK